MCSGWERVGEDGPGLLERCMNTLGGVDANHWIPGYKHPKAKRIAFDWAGPGWGRRESPVEMGEARWVTEPREWRSGAVPYGERGHIDWATQ